MKPADAPLVGREEALRTLGARLDQGLVVVLFGPVGVGKSALLRALQRRARRLGRPCGLVPRTDGLRDFTEVLARAYPAVAASATRRQTRSRLRLAAEARPGVLLLDHLGQIGNAFKGAIKSIRGTGIGVLLAADVDHPRDHDRVRALGLSHYEIPLRPLHASSMRALLRSLLDERTLPFALMPEHLRALVAATEGLPGRAVDFAEALVDPASWSRATPRTEWLRTGAAIRAAEHYRHAVELT
jgi:hypothetical protein